MTGRMMAAHQASGGGPWLVGGLMIRPESKYSGRDETDRPRNIARPNIHRRPGPHVVEEMLAPPDPAGHILLDWGRDRMTVWDSGVSHRSARPVARQR